VSDQDFFFDEDEAPQAAPKSESKSSAKTTGKSPAPRPRQNTSQASGGSFFEQNVTMAVAGLMTVIGLLVGVIIGYVVAPDATGAVSNTGSLGTGAAAPSLTEDQLNSGQLPAGHPDISGMASESVPATSN
jgi:hypothetical protein